MRITIKTTANSKDQRYYHPPGITIFLPVFRRLTLRQKKMTRTGRMAVMQLPVIA
jgi:hypothetical protein